MSLFVYLFVSFLKVAALTINVGNYSNDVWSMTNQSGLLCALPLVIPRGYYSVARKYEFYDYMRVARTMYLTSKAAERNIIGPYLSYRLMFFL